MVAAVKRNEKLKKIKFGNSDMMVTEVCAGTMTWGSFNGEEKEVHDQLDALWKLGVNWYDTAELYPVAFNYGKTTEEWIGNWLAPKLEDKSIDRKDIFIATKCNPEGIGGPKKGKHGYDIDTLMGSCKASLERLKCDYIDLYQLHWPARDIAVFGKVTYQNLDKGYNRGVNKGEVETFEEQVKNVKQLLDAGLIKYWGLSNENAYGVTMFCMACDKLGVPRPISLQNDFSLNNRIYEGDTLEACKRFGIVGLPYGVLSGGTLTGKYDLSKYAHESDRPLKQCRHNKDDKFQFRYMNPMARKAVQKYAALAEQYDITPTELALAWANSRWYNGSVIIGTTTVRQVEECVGAFKLELPDELIEEINVIHEEFRNPTAIYHEDKVAAAAPWL